ncbi:hypothetical protein KHA80_00200 [Anaerobacillus sp. HL2]|nr:hypothetical protein KHA80_00200 [Anaerobacillus sp. HL2]
MGEENMLQREKELLAIAFDKLSAIQSLTILQEDVRERLGVISFYIEGIHYNL